MKPSIAIAAAIGLSAMIPSAASAITLTFDGNICNGGQACGRGGVIDQSYGDTAAVDVQWRADSTGDATTGNGLRFWDTQYNELINVAYGANSPNRTSVFFIPTAGNSVTLTSFRLGAWPNTMRESSFTIVDGLGTILSNSGRLTIGVDNISTLVLAGFTSTNGLGIIFGPDSFNVGIDDIVFSTSAVVGAVPEPGSWAMMILGFGIAGAALRYRRRAMRVAFAR